jgi:hypothetical protein
MMATNSLLNALESYLNGAGLSPVPKGIGVAEPTKAAEIPAVVLSLNELMIPSTGLGEHAEAVTGALEAGSEIDLSNPRLPGDLSFNLLSPDGKSLTLLHGGLVDKDGIENPLLAADIQVSHDATTFTVVSGTPSAGQVNVSAAEGLLTFNDPLPSTGMLTAKYFVGQWERKIEQLAGLVDLVIVGGTNTEAAVLGANVMQAMANAVESISGMRKLIPATVGPVTSFALGTGTKRQRQLSWRFDYEHIINQAESSGGIIQRIAMRTRKDSSPVEEEEIS